MEVGKVNVRFTGDSSGFEGAANRASAAAKKTEATVVSLQDRAKKLQGGFSAAAGAANQMAGAFGAAGSKVSGFASSAVAALGAGGPWGAALALAVGGVTTLISTLNESAKAAEEAARRGAEAFSKQTTAVRDLATEYARAARLQGILLSGGNEATLAGLEGQERAKGMLGTAAGTLGQRGAALSGISSQIGAIEARGGARNVNEQSVLDDLRKQQRAAQTAYNAAARNFGTAFSNEQASRGVGQDQGPAVPTFDNGGLKAKTGGKSGPTPAEERIKAEIAAWNDLQKARAAANEEFLKGQDAAVQSYEDLMVAGDETAERELARFRQEEEIRNARGQGFLSGDQEKSALKKVGQDFDAATKASADKATEKFGLAGIDAATGFAQSFKTFMDTKNPADLFGGLLQAAGGILNLFLPGVGSAVAAIGSLFHTGGEIGGASPIYSHTGNFYGPKLRPDERHVVRQTGEGEVSRLGMKSMSPAELSYRNRTGRSPGGGGNSYTQIVQSLDTPSYSAFAPRTVEPVQKRRMQDRQGSLATRQLREITKPRRVA